MDPPEVLLLSSDEELFDPDQRLSEGASSLSEEEKSNPPYGIWGEVCPLPA